MPATTSRQTSARLSIREGEMCRYYAQRERTWGSQARQSRPPSTSSLPRLKSKAAAHNVVARALQKGPINVERCRSFSKCDARRIYTRTASSSPVPLRTENLRRALPLSAARNAAVCSGHVPFRGHGGATALSSHTHSQQNLRECLAPGGRRLSQKFLQ